MSKIILYNSKTRKKEPFYALDEKNVRMYVCGPTVYERAHLGNARPVVIFDILYRLLINIYGFQHVDYVRNFTDIDDKINDRAKSLQVDIKKITEETIEWFLEDMGELNSLLPNSMPRATEYIDEMIDMINDLIKEGHAYSREGHVYFSVRSYPNYGSLSGRSLDDMIAGSRVEISNLKRDPLDFILWKPSTNDLPGWASPWGRGRPGWHIECSAMSKKLLGASFDIHCGGSDLRFPHHENEIAQSQCANPNDHFANFWLHNEMLQVGGKKMSKSLGNFYTVKDLLDENIPGEVIRFILLNTHYRKPLDWTKTRVDEAKKILNRWRNQTNDITPGEVDPSIIEALSDDLNSVAAISRLHKLSRDGDFSKLLASAQFIGLLMVVDEKKFSPTDNEDIIKSISNLLLQSRKKAFLNNSFTEFDTLKQAVLEAGLEVQVSRDSLKVVSTENFDVAALKGIVDE